MKHTFRCMHCGEKITHHLLHPSSLAKCPYCQKEYIVVKNVLMMTIELILMFAIAVGVRSLMNLTNTTFHILLELGVVIVMLYVLNMLFDIFVIKVLKYSDHLRLVERKDPKELKDKKEKNK